MNKRLMAEQLADLCYKSKGYNSTEFAAQLFIEQTVLPNGVEAYSKKEIQDYILAYLYGN